MINCGKTSSAKVTTLVVMGNILDYYDFLLFAHLGPIITPLFFPGLESVTAHILSLFLFGLSFLVRPIGGYLFGRISDLTGRKTALIKTVKWAIFPTLGLAMLPAYETLGITATVLFVILRLIQGFSLGGEYPNAGTYLMEYHKQDMGKISGILAGSGTIGSLLGLGMAYLCLQEYAPTGFWRFAFFLGAVGGTISFMMRKHLAEIIAAPQSYPPVLPSVPKWKWILVMMIGILVGTSVWLPSTYSNFYVTKILGYSMQEGVKATFMALIGYIILTPLFGAISDRFGHYRMLLWSSIMTIPVSIISFFLLYQDQIVMAQLGLITAAAAFGAPIHVVMNGLFPRQTRGRSVGLLFMLGLSIGGLAPSLSGYIVSYTALQAAPAYLLSVVASLAAITLYSCRRHFTPIFASNSS